MARYVPLAVGVVLGGLLAWGGPAERDVAMAQTCDPSYPEICLPADLGIGCLELGLPIRVIHDPSLGAYDPLYLDPDFDGIGCEFA